MTGHESNRFSSFPHRAISARLAKLRSRAANLPAGFTLIEFMVVLVIIGLLSGMAVPKFLRADAEAKLEGDAQKVLLNFRLAKQAANKTNLRHWVRLLPPRVIEVWRAKADTDFTFNPADDTLLFRDSLNIKSMFGFSSTDLSGVSSHPVGFEAPSNIGASQDGLGRSNNTFEDCGNGMRYSPSTDSMNNLGWNRKSSGDYVISACGSSISEMTEGIAYLTSTGSKDKMFALAFSRQHVQLRLYRFSNSTPAVWEEL